MPRKKIAAAAKSVCTSADIELSLTAALDEIERREGRPAMLRTADKIFHGVSLRLMEAKRLGPALDRFNASIVHAGLVTDDETAAVRAGASVARDSVH
jgi:hypothetical protein